MKKNILKRMFKESPIVFLLALICLLGCWFIPMPIIPIIVFAVGTAGMFFLWIIVYFSRFPYP
ncbi:TPA: hypothetical protein DF272_04290 [Candidatus Falkowbacteria bacterium]|nr:hypothetical protein [Candidatus Falkowbacteria bacterium]